LRRAVTGFLNVFTHDNGRALHLHSVHIKRNRQEYPLADIYKMVCCNTLRKGATFDDEPAFAGIQSLRDYLRIVRGATFLDYEEKRFGAGQENRPAMSSFSFT
jgi:hypothetical protein